MYICETCREQARPNSDPGIVFAVVLKEVSGFNASGSREFAEGQGRVLPRALLSRLV
jgi:hypothetical protein